MPATNVERTLGLLLAKVEGIERHLVQVRDDMHDSEQKSDTSRANVHRRLDEATNRMGILEGSVAAIESTIAEVQSVTDDVKKMREQARGAGTMGKVLMRIGIALLAAAGWLAAAYTQMTGRPPP